jgi:hypothetical protein
MSTTDPKIPEPRRLSTRLPHWGWFLLATVIMTLAYGPLSIWQQYQREQQIVKKIEVWGGRAFTKSSAPMWLRRFAGEKHLKVFDRVNNVVLQETNVTDADVAQLAGLTTLVELDLNGTQVGDPGLASLSELTNLGYLYLNRAQIGDAALVHLGRLPNLKELRLGGTQVTDEGVESLTRALPHCKVVR